jgi:hypothetical protein
MAERHVQVAVGGGLFGQGFVQYGVDALAGDGEGDRLGRVGPKLAGRGPGWVFESDLMMSPAGRLV